MALTRVAVLVSGSGTNLAALIEAARLPDASFSIVLVLANRPDAYGLVRAAEAGIAAACIEHRAFRARPDFEAALDAALANVGAELVCLAGFMRVLTPGFVARWRDRLLNIHPSLLPAFPGLATHARVLASGARIHGCTVHLVRAEVDDGPILLQGVVPVLPGDDAPALAARVLGLEHAIYPLALELVAGGKLRVADGRVIASAPEVERARLILHPALLADPWAARARIVDQGAMRRCPS